MLRGLPKIWIITDPDHPDGPVAPIRRALADSRPGLVGVQLRAKRASDRRLVEWGRELRVITSAVGGPLTVNRRPDVAKIVGADGVHLPELGLRPRDVARYFPDLELIGVSRHDAAGLRNAAVEGASYAFLSPIFEVPGKGQPLGVGGFSAAIADVGMAIFALGGLGPAQVEPLLAAGAFGIAVRRAIYQSRKPEEALHRLIRELDKHVDNGE